MGFFEILGIITPAQEAVVRTYEKPLNSSSSSKQPPMDMAASTSTADALPKTKDVLIVQKEPSPDMTTIGHLLLTFFFYAAMILYIVAESINFVTAKPMTQFSQRPVNNFAPIELEVTPHCASEPCGDISLKVNYSNYRDTPCFQNYASSNGVMFMPAVTRGTTVKVQLCYVADEAVSTSTQGPLELNGISIGYSNLSAGGSGTVEVRSSARGARLQRVINIDRLDVKTLMLGVSVTEKDGFRERVEPFGLQTILEGFRKAASTRGDVLIRVNFNANVVEHFDQRTWLNLLASIGNAFTLLGVLFVVIVPVFTIVFAKRSDEDEEAKKKAEQEENKESVSAFESA